MKTNYKVELKITQQLGGGLIDTIQVGEFKTLKTAYKEGLKKSSQVECNYSTWSNHTVIINGREAYEDLNDKICLS